MNIGLTTVVPRRANELHSALLPLALWRGIAKKGMAWLSKSPKKCGPSDPRPKDALILSVRMYIYICVCVWLCIYIYILYISQLFPTYEVHKTCLYQFDPIVTSIAPSSQVGDNNDQLWDFRVLPTSPSLVNSIPLFEPIHVGGTWLHDATWVNVLVSNKVKHKQFQKMLNRYIYRYSTTVRILQCYRAIRQIP
jgi:hypothetical protein